MSTRRLLAFLVLNLALITLVWSGIVEAADLAPPTPQEQLDTLTEC